MSRSKEGMDKEKNAATSRQADEPSRPNYLDERLGAKGQTDYTAGRESWREFPKRSTSLRARTDTDTESRDLYDSSSRRDYETRSGTRNVNRYESPYQVRNESRGSYPDYPRGAGCLPGGVTDVHGRSQRAAEASLSGMRRGCRVGSEETGSRLPLLRNSPAVDRSTKCGGCGHRRTRLGNRTRQGSR